MYLSANTVAIWERPNLKCLDDPGKKALVQKRWQMHFWPWCCHIAFLSATVLEQNLDKIEQISLNFAAIFPGFFGLLNLCRDKNQTEKKLRKCARAILAVLTKLREKHNQKKRGKFQIVNSFWDRLNWNL